MGPRAVLYSRPLVDAVGAIDAYVRSFLDRKCTVSANIDWRAGQMKEFIDCHPERVSRELPDVFKQLSISLSGRQGRRIFKLSTGIGPGEYLNYKRLVIAAERLQTTDDPVKAVAAEAGYAQTRNFARRFRNLFHLSPMEFRRISRRGRFAALTRPTAG